MSIVCGEKLDLKGLAGKLLNHPEEKGAEEKELSLGGKFNEKCALCGNIGTDKKWMGQFWHKKCIRRSKRVVKGMV